MERHGQQPSAVVRTREDVEAWFDESYPKRWKPTPFGRYEVEGFREDKLDAHEFIVTAMEVRSLV